MNKVVYSPCYGGYGLSDEAKELFKKISKEDWGRDTPRHHPALIEAVETLGTDKASDIHAELFVAEIEGFQYIIDEYDGYESVQTPEDDVGWIEINNKYSREKWPEYFI